MKFESITPYPGDETDLLHFLNPRSRHLKPNVALGTPSHPSEPPSYWHRAAEIDELSGLKGTGGHLIHCINAPNIRLFGYCHRADCSPGLEKYGINALIVLNPRYKDPGLPLVDLYLHEVAHLYCDSECHDWKFATILNALRISNGLGPTVDEYDCRDGLTSISSDDHLLTTEHVNIANELAEFLGARLARQPDWWQHAAGILEMVEFSLEDAFLEDPIDIGKIKAECIEALGL